MTTTASDDLREVTEADVYVEDEAVASLSRVRDDVVFNYTSRSTANGGPVRERSVAWSLLVTGAYPPHNDRRRRSPVFCRPSTRGCPARGCHVVDQDIFG